jgi:hypothetical protein
MALPLGLQEIPRLIAPTPHYTPETRHALTYTSSLASPFCSLQQCPTCRLPKHLSEYTAHVAAKSCTPQPPPAQGNKCPLCAASILPGEEVRVIELGNLLYPLDLGPVGRTSSSSSPSSTSFLDELVFEETGSCSENRKDLVGGVKPSGWL